MIGSIISTGINLVDGIVRQSKEKKKRKQVISSLDTQKRDLTKWYDTKINSDFIESTNAKDAMTALRQEKRSFDTAQADKLTASGATAEQSVAKSAKANQDYAKAIATIAASGDKYKQQIDALYLNNMNKIDEDIKRAKIGEGSFKDYYGDTISKGINLFSNSLKNI